MKAGSITPGHGHTAARAQVHAAAGCRLRTAGKLRLRPQHNSPLMRHLMQAAHRGKTSPSSAAQLPVDAALNARSLTLLIFFATCGARGPASALPGRRGRAHRPSRLVLYSPSRRDARRLPDIFAKKSPFVLCTMAASARRSFFAGRLRRQAPRCARLFLPSPPCRPLSPLRFASHIAGRLRRLPSQSQGACAPCASSPAGGAKCQPVGKGQVSGKEKPEKTSPYHKLWAEERTCTCLPLRGRWHVASAT